MNSFVRTMVTKLCGLKRINPQEILNQKISQETSALLAHFYSQKFTSLQILKATKSESHLSGMTADKMSVKLTCLHIRDSKSTKSKIQKLNQLYSQMSSFKHPNFVKYVDFYFNHELNVFILIQEYTISQNALKSPMSESEYRQIVFQFLNLSKQTKLRDILSQIIISKNSLKLDFLENLKIEHFLAEETHLIIFPIKNKSQTIVEPINYLKQIISILKSFLFEAVCKIKVSDACISFLKFLESPREIEVLLSHYFFDVLRNLKQKHSKNLIIETQFNDFYSSNGKDLCDFKEDGTTTINTGPQSILTSPMWSGNGRINAFGSIDTSPINLTNKISNKKSFVLDWQISRQTLQEKKQQINDLSKKGFVENTINEENEKRDIDIFNCQKLPKKLTNEQNSKKIIKTQSLKLFYPVNLVTEKVDKIISKKENQKKINFLAKNISEKEIKFPKFEKNKSGPTDISIKPKTELLKEDNQNHNQVHFFPKENEHFNDSLPHAQHQNNISISQTPCFPRSPGHSLIKPHNISHSKTKLSLSKNSTVQIGSFADFNKIQHENYEVSELSFKDCLPISKNNQLIVESSETIEFQTESPQSKECNHFYAKILNKIQSEKMFLKKRNLVPTDFCLENAKERHLAHCNSHKSTLERVFV